MSWLPIESAPKSLEEICALYPEGFGMTVLIGRSDFDNGDGSVVLGCVAECTIHDDGRWVFPIRPDFLELQGRDGWGWVESPTHWQPLPEPPTDDRWELTEAGRAMRGGK